MVEPYMKRRETEKAGVSERVREREMERGGRDGRDLGLGRGRIG